MSLFAVEIHDLTVLVDKYPLVSHLNLTVEPGNGVVFIGYPDDLHQLLRVLSGDVLPEEGEIFYYNEPPRRARERGLIEAWTPDANDFLSTPPSPILITLGALLPSFPPTSSLLSLSYPHTPFIEKINKSNKAIRIINLTRGCEL